MFIPFYDYYRTPTIERIVDKPKNLVFIDAESLDRSYFDETIYPGLITHLRKYQADATTFTNIKQLPYTNYTIAGMTASQLGVPLVTISGVNSMASMDTYHYGNAHSN